MFKVGMVMLQRTLRKGWINIIKNQTNGWALKINKMKGDCPMYSYITHVLCNKGKLELRNAEYFKSNSGKCGGHSTGALLQDFLSQANFNGSWLIFFYYPGYAPMLLSRGFGRDKSRISPNIWRRYEPPLHSSPTSFSNFSIFGRER